MPLNYYADQLQQLKAQGQYRQFPAIQHQGKWIWQDQRRMLNLSSNDYLGMASDTALQAAFLRQQDLAEQPLTSASSRLLTGHFPIYDQLEQYLADQFQRPAALLFNSGYHANIGILPAVADKQTLILADKLVHASLIDGIRLSQSTYFRYRHNDYAHLAQLLAQHAPHYERIIIVTESLFSMDGDYADLRQLVALKQHYSQLMLYVDEAHAIGVLGQNGLGLAEQLGCLADIDFLVGTFGKAVGSMGAYLICDAVMKAFLINKMRPLIFSTALPPLQVAWSYFALQQLRQAQAKRQHLAQLSAVLRQQITQISPQPLTSQSHIIPWVIGDNLRTVQIAEQLQHHGFYCLPIRPPTVPKGTARLRFSLTAAMTQADLEPFFALLAKHRSPDFP